MSNQEAYEQYKKYMRRITDVRYSVAVLQWDQETYLPAKGASFRGQQIATLSEIAHELMTGDKLGETLNTLIEGEGLSPQQYKNVSTTLEDYNKQKKFTSAFVRKMSETVSAAFHAWMEARKQNSFVHFAPTLAGLVELKKQEAELLGYIEHPYDALLNEYEKGATVSMLDKVFNDVKAPLRQLLKEVGNQPVDVSFLHQHFNRQQQMEWGNYLAKELGFDFEAGRQDLSEHPFTINFSSQDVRITTRIDEHDFANMTWSTIHEVGHALYEQGLPAEEYGLPLGEYTSLGIHESQSRIWENCIGRSTEFWQHYLPKLQTYFPDQFTNVDCGQFVQAINKVQPSLIRTEADELTYHFHVIIRYELEKKLIEGTLDVADIPAYWNEQYKQLLGVDVPDDKHGCLQDVHWSHGSFGYFPTYSLGSFYAAQFWQTAQNDLPGIKSEIANTGNTQLLLDWLRLKVHKYGKFYTSEELCILVTGKPLDSAAFIDYLRVKYKEIYSY